MENLGSKFGCFCVGLGIGAIVSLLIAPKSGEETRAFIAEQMEKSKEYAQRKAHDLRERVEDLADRGKQVVAQKAESSSAASDVGREAYQREKSKIP